MIRDRPETIPKNNTGFTEEDYRKRCLTKPHLKGFASFAYSFGGKHWGGWSRGKNSAGTARDYVAESYNNAQKQSPGLQGVHLEKKPFQDIDLSESCIIYCDPPYKGTTKYKTCGFDHDAFWNWCKKMANEGHTVYVSEYSGPDFASVVWEKEVHSGLRRTAKDNEKATEKLFLVES